MIAPLHQLRFEEHDGCRIPEGIWQVKALGAISRIIMNSKEYHFAIGSRF